MCAQCCLPALLTRQGEQAARGPVHATLCENWAVYHFWSLAHHRFEMAVIELYDSTPRDVSIANVLFGGSNASLSAFAPPPIEVAPLTAAAPELRWGLTSCLRRC